MNGMNTGHLIIAAVLISTVSIASEAQQMPEDELEQEPQSLAVDLIGGSHIIGVPDIETFPLQTDYAKINIPIEQIESIAIDADHETATFVLQNGDTVTGVLNIGELSLKTAFGLIKVRTPFITSIQKSVKTALPLALQKDLVLWYDFAKDEKDKVTDKSGAGNDGKAEDATWEILSDRRQGVLESHKAISVPSVAMGAQWSFACWSQFPLRATAGGWRTLLFSGASRHHAIVSKEGQLGCYVAGFWDSGFSVKKLKGWHHMAGVALDGKTVFYIDGKKVGTSTKVCTPPVTRVGNAVGSPQDWAVPLDEVMIWNRAFSEAEVKQVYKATGGK
jgi:hypothetical protein